MSQGRKGHTLVEVIAVVAILAAVAAISFPMIKPMMSDGHKDAAADVVRARWAELRGKAMKNQRPYSFEIKEGTVKFRCVAEADDSDDAADAALAGDLPGEIKFANAESSSSSGGWTKIVTFMPDGSARTFGKEPGLSKLTFSNGSHSLTLQVHGATGMVSEFEENKK
jgi:prepilin-type N-terminal cleavage/methylation domain-containing protein